MAYIIKKCKAKTAHSCFFCDKQIDSGSFCYIYEYPSNYYKSLYLCQDCNEYMGVHGDDIFNIEKRKECEAQLKASTELTKGDMALKHAGFTKLEENKRFIFYARQEKTKTASFKTYIFINKMTKKIATYRFEYLDINGCPKDLVGLIFDKPTLEAIIEKMSELP